MPVITVSRQLGSGGTQIARELAERLGLQYVDRQVIFQAAAEAGTPAAALAEMDEFGILAPLLGPKERRAFVAKIDTVVRSFAEKGDCIIVGRGSQIILRNWPDTLHLQVVAPAEVRLQRLVLRHKLDRQTALNRIEASDRNRAIFIRRSYHSDWMDSHLYDLVLNTGRISPTEAVDVILLALKKIATGGAKGNPN